VIFLLQRGHHEPDQTPKLVPSATPGFKFLFNTNGHFTKSATAVTHSKQTADFPFHPREARKMLDVAVTHSKSMTAQISIQYKWALRNSASLSKKSANPAHRVPRA
jgi:hypothetical protein